MNESILNGIPAEQLSTEREDELARDGTPESRNTLVLHNLREAFFYSWHHCRGQFPEGEVLSAAYRALEHASRNYRPGTKPGVRFFAYCKPYLRGSICKEWKLRDVVKNSKHETLNQEEYPLDGGGEIDTNVERVRAIWPIVELDFHSINTRERLKYIREAMKECLSDHERMILELTYLAHYEFKDVAKQLGVTRSAVRNTHRLAVEKLRVALAQKQRLL